MNFSMETKFQLKCYLQHGSDLPLLQDWQVVALLSVMFVEGHAFVLFI